MSMNLLCRMCATDTNPRRDDRTLSQKIQEDGISERTSVEVISARAKRGFSCQDCGGLTGYAVTPSCDVVAISDLPSDRFSSV